MLLTKFVVYISFEEETCWLVEKKNGMIYFLTQSQKSIWYQHFSDQYEMKLFVCTKVGINSTWHVCFQIVHNFPSYNIQTS